MIECYKCKSVLYGLFFNCVNMVIQYIKRVDFDGGEYMENTKHSFKIHSVKYNFIMNVVLKISTFIFPLITFPYVSRVLGPIGNGKVSFATSVLYYFCMIATLGIPTYGVKICAQFRDDKKRLSKVVKELLVIESIMMVVSYLLFFIALCFVPRLSQDKTLMLINSMTIVLTVFGVEWFYQAIEQYDYITFRNILFKIISIILMFICVHEPQDYIIYGAINVLGTVGSNILNILRLNQFVNFKDNSKLELSKHLKPTFILFMFSASTMIYTSLDTVMLGFIKGDEAVGYYNAAVKLKNLLVSLVTALGTVLLPRLSHALAKKDFLTFTYYIKKSFNFVMLISLPITFFCILEAPSCIDFLAGPSYEQSILPMQLISIAIIFIGFTNIIGIQVLIPLGKEKYTVISTMAGALVNLVLNAALIPLFSSSGAALATSIAELIVLLVQIYYIRKKIYDFVDIKNQTKIIFSCLFSIIVLILVNHFIILENAFLNLIYTGILFFTIYMISLILLKEEMIVNNVLNLIKNVKN